jgi:hypothetical protein
MLIGIPRGTKPRGGHSLKIFLTHPIGHSLLLRTGKVPMMELAVRNCTDLPCIALHCTALHFSALHCPALPCTAQHCTASTSGTVKRLASRSSLQRTVNNQILSPRDLHAFAEKNIPGIKMMWCGTDEITTVSDNTLNERYKMAKTIKVRGGNYRKLLFRVGLYCSTIIQTLSFHYL